MYEPTREEWKQIVAELHEPIPAEQVELKWTDPAHVSPGRPAQVSAYATSRGVRDVLDKVAPGAWAFELGEPALDAKGHVVSGRCSLIIYGVRRDAYAEAPNYSPDRGWVSNVEKLAGQQWGIGRIFYDLPVVMATPDRDKKIPAEYIERWRASYAKLIGKTLAEVGSPSIVEADEDAAEPAQVAAPVAPAAALEGGHAEPAEAPESAEPLDENTPLGKFIAAVQSKVMLTPAEIQEKLGLSTLDGYSTAGYRKLWVQLDAALKAPAQEARNDLGVPTGSLEALHAFATRERGLSEPDWINLAKQCKNEPDAIRGRFNHMIRAEQAQAAEAETKAS